MPVIYPSHPRVQARGPRADAPKVRVIAYSSSPDRMNWIEKELSSTFLTIARSISAVIGALIEDPAPRPAVLVIDLDPLSAGEILELHAIREGGWTGAIIGLGKVPPSLRHSLNIETTLRFPLVDDALHDAVAEIRFDAKTTRLPVFADL